VCAGAAGAIIYVASGDSERTPTAGNVTAAAPAADPGVGVRTPTLNNSTTIVSVRDTRKTRDHAFKQAKEGFAAEGVTLDKTGAVTMVSQGTGGKVSQTLTAAALVKDGKVLRTLALNKKPEVVTDSTAKYSTVVYRDLFEGLDVEYRYDGKDVEEFIRLSDGVKRELVQSGGELEVTGLFPGLTEKGTLIEGRGVPPPGTKQSPEAEQVLKERGIMESLDLVVDARHRVTLPPSIALDEGTKKLMLGKRMSFTPKGLEMKVSLPAEFAAEAQGQVIIDPSIIDGPRGIQMNWAWYTNTGAIIKDDQVPPKFHITYAAVHGGQWTAMYVRGDGNTWTAPAPIAPHTPGEGTHYAPSMAIDSEGTLHAIWVDWGSGDVVNRGITDARHRLKYSKCPNYCQGGWATQQWLTKEANGGVATGGGNQYAATIAVDKAVGMPETVHVAFRDSDSGTRYLYNDGGNWQSLGVIVTDTEYNQLLVAGHPGPGGRVQRLHLITMPWWGGWGNEQGAGDKRVKHFYYDGASWNALPFTKAFNRARLNHVDYVPMAHHMPSAVVDSRDNIHVAVGAYYYWDGFDNYRTAALTWEYTAQSWVEIRTVNRPAGVTVDTFEITQDPYHEVGPTLTVTAADPGAGIPETVWLAWQKETNPPRIYYSTKVVTDGTVDEWAVPGAPGLNAKALLPVGPGQIKPQIRQRANWPSYRGSTAMNPAGLVDMVYIEDFANLKYYSTGSPVESPVLAKPLDHTYVKETKPVLEWRKIASDDGVKTHYDVEVAPTPLFGEPCTTCPFTSYNVLKNVSAVTVQGAGGVAVLTNGSYYYWRIRAGNDYGKGPWSTIYEVGVDTTAPGAFNLQTPADNTDPGTKTPTFTWTAAPN
jgi:hypothetical protein